MSQELDNLLEKAIQAISQSEDLAALDTVRVGYLGKKGEITAKLKSLGQISTELRPAVGQAINRVKLHIQASLEERKSAINDQLIIDKLSSETVDVTLPGRGLNPGVFTQSP